MTKNKKNLIMAVYLIIISLLSLSCTGSRQLQTLALVTSIGIDLEDDKIIITCEIMNPISNNSSNSSSGISPNPTGSVFAQSVGETVFEAVRNITLNFDRKLFLSHNNILIFGEEFAKKGITGFMDVFLRDSEAKENMYILVAKGAKAYEIIGVKGELSQSSGDYLLDILNDFKYNGKCLKVSMSEYYKYHYDIGNEPVIGVVTKIEKKEVDRQKSKDNTAKFMLDVAGGAILSRDYLIGYLSSDEIFGYNFITGRIEGGLIKFNTPQGLNKGNTIIGNEGKFTTVEIIQTKTKRDIKIDDGKIHLNINVKLSGSLGEENKGIDISNLEVIRILEKACSEKVEDLISITMDKGQKEFKQDNFSIGEIVHRQYPKVWKEISNDWNNIFPEISYTVNVETKIVKTGIINTPSNLRKRR